MFQYDSAFSTLVRRVFGCLLLGVLWLVCCLPVVTVGAASCGLYYAVQKHIIREEGELFGCYWHAFKENFRTATLTWLVFLAVGRSLGGTSGTSGNCCWRAARRACWGRLSWFC